MSRWLLVVAAFAAMALSNGAHAHPLAAWIGPLLMVRLVRDATGRSGVALGWLVFVAAWLVGWAGVFRLGLAELAPMGLILSGLGFVPFWLDRIVAWRLPILAASLVLPCANVAVEAGLGLASPFGAWGALGYSQVELLPLAQLASLTGVHGLSFLPFWFASLAVSAWDARSAGRSWRMPAFAFLSVMLIVLGFGGMRLFAGDERPRLAAAMVAPSLQSNANYDEWLGPRIADELFDASSRAAAGGALLVAWPEDSLFLRRVAEGKLLARAARLAERRRIHLALAYGLRIAPQGLAYRNRLVLIGPDGRMVWRYDKAHPVPGYEARHMQPGSAPIARAATSLGILAGAICYDGDHEMVLEGAVGARLLLLPSDDWPAIATLHARMARLRALEIGIPLLRPTINGIAVASDAKGSLLAWRDSRRPENFVIHADLPLNAKPTLRSVFPLWFPAVATILLSALLAWALLRSRATAPAADAQPSESASVAGSAAGS